MSRDALSMTVLNLNDGALAHVVLSRCHKSSPFQPSAVRVIQLQPQALVLIEGCPFGLCFH